MQENVVVCLLVGDKYTTDYVYKLKSMVARHCNTRYDFVCYSDREIEGIDVILIETPEEMEPVWYKIKMLGDPLLSKYTCKVFFDLDIVIHDSIDKLFYQPASLNVIQSLWKSDDEINSFLNTGCNSSIMVWSDASEIYQRFIKDPNYFMSKYTGMDRFLWHDARDKIEFIGPGIAYTYSFGASQKDNQPHIMRESYAVCLYNQFPKPDSQIEKEPAKSHWR